MALEGVSANKRVMFARCHARIVRGNKRGDDPNEAAAARVGMPP